MTDRGSLKRIAFGVWLALPAVLVIALFSPVNSRRLRLLILLISAALIVGSILFSLKNRRTFVAVLCAISAVAIGLSMPGRESVGDPLLRAEYIEAMTDYEGVAYVWGGETRFGMDCSGLVRKGFQNALLHRGIATCNPALIRAAFDVWWNDTTARELGGGYDGRTFNVTSCSSLNALDHASIQPGDLAVTSSGIHVMAYLGKHRWIGADPEEMKVTIFKTPETKNAWFVSPMDIVRWTRLGDRE